MWKSLISIKGKEKNKLEGVILGQKLTLNHPSLVDEGEETRVLMTAHKREMKKFKSLIFSFDINFLEIFIIWKLFASLSLN